MNNTALQRAEFVPHIIADMSNEDYHSQPAISKSGLDLIAKSPAHFYAEKISTDESIKREQTKSLDIGTAFHLLALEPENFDKYIAIDSDSYPTKKECGRTIEQQRDEFAASNPGKIILREKDMEGLRERAKSIRNHPAAKYLLQGNGMVEPSVFARQPFFEIDCRIRPDWLRHDDLIIDLKTTKDASAHGFDKAIFNYRYHVQAAFYMDMYELATGKKSPGFVLIPVENSAPFLTGEPVLIEEGDLWLDIGRREYMANIETYGHCLDTGIYPGYGNEIRKSIPPQWVK